MKHLEKFLEFNGKRIAVLHADGTWWVAVKPICEALGVDFQAQHKSILADEILGQLSSEQTTVAADNKLRKMTCLPERYIYGWLFSIRSDNSLLIEYKRKCYDILYDHFHGALTARMTVLNRRDDIALRILELEEKLEESEEYQEILKLKKLKSETTKTLARLDQDLKSGQISMDLK